MKQCPKCDRSKPLCSFNKNPSTKDGLQRYCADCYKQVKRDYYARNKERLLQGFAERYKQDPELFLARTAEYYSRNRDVIAQRTAIWRTNNKEVQAVQKSRRRAREAGAPGSHTAQDVKEILRLQKSCCACCGRPVHKSYHLDHIVALARGGSNDRTNLQILCKDCNLSKHAKDPLDFMRARGFLL